MVESIVGVLITAGICALVLWLVKEIAIPEPYTKFSWIVKTVAVIILIAWVLQKYDVYSLPVAR